MFEQSHPEPYCRILPGRSPERLTETCLVMHFIRSSISPVFTGRPTVVRDSLRSPLQATHFLEKANDFCLRPYSWCQPTNYRPGHRLSRGPHLPGDGVAKPANIGALKLE